ncbi:MAG: hypothetical protein H6Q33_4374 [Deltaproteobacteria bacterium]|nr:hypothetical protein [Deltaproteobacteria bacterium]
MKPHEYRACRAARTPRGLPLLFGGLILSELDRLWGIFTGYLRYQHRSTIGFFDFHDRNRHEIQTSQKKG